jgi:uncharacterized protein
MSEDKILQLISAELKLKPIQVINTVNLLDDGNTVPFIARYRKENTGSLDEEQIRSIEMSIQYLRALEERKKTVLKSIEEQGKLTPELKKKIEETNKLQDLEDLYLPFKPKKRTRATIAKEKGLQPFAEIILAQELVSGDVLEIAEQYINSEKEVNTVEEALDGAKDIIAEKISENADVRKILRNKMFKNGILESSVKSDETDKQYEMYFDYSEKGKRIPPHRILAINRGEKEKVIKVSISVDVDLMLSEIAKIYIKKEVSIFYETMKLTIEDAYLRLIKPSLEREIRNMMTEKADQHAIEVFAVNLKNLLLQPPISGNIIMGIDPGFRTGCKVAIIDKTGKYLKGETIYPHPPQKKYYEAKTIVRTLIEEFGVDIVAIGNGTASRETELMIAELIRELKSGREVKYLIVNEAGASVYSASPVAKEEFPELEASMRGNISIARRLQDPLAELVKIDPKSIGVGLYQHDVNQRQLTQTLRNVVESCVNSVGVDINTASSSLLKYVSGLTSKTSKNIVKFRDDNGPFDNREVIKTVEGIGEIAFQQAAGFLRINNGDNTLDATSIHPESYKATKKLLHKFSISDISQGGRTLRKKIFDEKLDLAELASIIDCGVPTLEDILLDLEKPGRNPRDDMPKPLFKSDVLKMEDLREGMILQGTVRNVVDFGAFVDIGVKQDGLIHISQLADKFIKSPYEIVSVGDVVKVKIVSVDLERQRIALSMKNRT